MDTQPSYDELNTVTSQAREEKKKLHFERIKLGREDAIKHITEGCFEKMKDSANKGFDKTDFYSFSWVENPEDKCDKNGNKTVFEGNVRLLDLITKGKHDFIKALNMFFNTEGESKYHCGFYKKRNQTTNLDVWNIFVSWSIRSNRNPENSSGRGYRNQSFSGRGRGRGYISQENPIDKENSSTTGRGNHSQSFSGRGNHSQSSSSRGNPEVNKMEGRGGRGGRSKYNGRNSNL